MEISDENIQEMAEYLGGVEEPRRTEYGNFRHKLTGIIVIAFTATLCGSDEFEETGEFGRLKQDFFKTFPELPDGMPDESAFRKVTSRLDPVQPRKSMDNRLPALRSGKKPSILRPGRSILTENDMGEQKSGRERGSRGKRAGRGKQSDPPGELATDEKSNGITAVPEMVFLNRLICWI
jgi:hypothetical protein